MIVSGGQIMRVPARGDCLICTVLCTVYRDTVIGTNRTRESVIGVYSNNSFKTVVIVLILLLVS
jgi:hypothetical protein